MSTILILTAAGGCMTIFYLVYLHTIRGTYWSRRIWLTVAALFYLVPLGDLKGLYVSGLHRIGKDKYLQGMYYSDLSDFVEIRMEELVYKNETFRLDTLFYAVWMIGAAGILLYNLIQYFMQKYWILSEYKPAGEKELEVLERLKSSMKIRRKIRLMFYERTSPMTIGFFRPVIVLPEKMRDNLPELILKHELAHTRNGDTLVKVVLTLILIIHWFNPFAHIMVREYEKLFELMSDEKAVDGCSGKEKIDYVNKLVEESKPVLVKKSFWSHYLSKQGKFLKERIDSVMEKKRIGKMRTCVGSIAMAAALFVSSLTALAYEDVHGLETDKSLGTKWSGSESTDAFTDAEFWFDFYEDFDVNVMSASVEDIIILYDEQFIDEDGNVFEVNFDAVPYYNCNHNFKGGVLTRHATYADGSCTVEYYHGQMCTICSYTIVGDFIMETKYATCPH